MIEWPLERDVIDWPLERDLERSFAAARDTRERIAPFVRHTPLLEVDATGHPRRLLKLESLQHTGSFKIRGAASAISAGPRPRELVAASTGNHGLAVAAVAARLGLPCRVYVPAGAARAKLRRLREAGVELVEVDSNRGSWRIRAGTNEPDAKTGAQPLYELGGDEAHH